MHGKNSAVDFFPYLFGFWFFNLIHSMMDLFDSALFLRSSTYWNHIGTGCMSCHTHTPQKWQQQTPENIVVGSPLSFAGRIFSGTEHCTLWTTPDTIRDNEKCTVMQRSSTNGLGFLVFHKKHRKRSHKFVALCNTHIFCCSSPSWNKSISSNSTSSKQKNTKHQFEGFAPTNPNKNTPQQPPKTTGSSFPQRGNRSVGAAGWICGMPDVAPWLVRGWKPLWIHLPGMEAV